MQNLWLTANVSTGELNMLATEKTIFVGMIVDPVFFDPILNDYQVYPIDRSFYRVLPKAGLLVLMSLGELGEGSARGKHQEALEAVYSVLPEASGVQAPTLSEDALKVFRAEMQNPGDLMAYAARSLAHHSMAFALRAYLLGMVAG